jgi:septal ring factor EnvC (AmiA/AmiB activator)
MIKALARWILRQELEITNERSRQYARDADRCESLRRRAESELKVVRHELARTRQDLERTEKISMNFQTALSGNNESIEQLYAYAYPHMPDLERERWVCQLGLPSLALNIPQGAKNG